MQGSSNFRALLGLGCLAALAVTAAGQSTKLEAVSFPTEDGVTIFADYCPPPGTSPPAPIAILIHQYQSDRGSWQPLIGPLHAAGFAVLAIDLRGHGESATTQSRAQVRERDPDLFKEMHNDVRGAYDWLAANPGHDRARVALVGASVGVSVALQYAARDCSVDAIIGLSPGLDYMGLDSAGDMGQLRGRQVLLLAAEGEKSPAEKLKTRTKGVEVTILPGKAHGTELLGAAPALDKQLTRFLLQAVGEPSSKPVYGTINSNIFHEPGSGWIDQIKPGNLRVYSSAREAEARGLRAARNKGPGDRPGRDKRDTGDKGNNGDKETKGSGRQGRP